MSLTKLCSENVCAEVQNRETPTKKRRSQTEKHEEIDEECSRAYEDGSKNCLNEQFCHTMSSRKRHAEKIVGSDHVDVAVKKNRQGDENNVGETCAKHSGGVTEKCKNGTNTENSYEAQLYLQVVYMFVGLGTKLLLELFLYLLKHDDIDMSLVDFLKSNETKQRLIKLSRDKVINEKEYRLATANNPKAENFDISLLLTLMRNLLPNTILSPPKYGWTKPPPQSDGSISADLLRLRKIRNDIIAHSARPQIPQSKYERTRDELIQILYRLTQKIYPCKSKDEIMNEIQEKVDSYQVCVDSPLTKYCIGRVQEWHLNFTNKVEESLKTLNEFDLYLTNKSNRYERYMKLLLKGGKNVLFGTLKRECRRKKYNIEDMSEFIKSSDHTEIESERKNWNSNPSNWDVWQLSTLLLDKFDKDLSANEVEEIVKIQKAVTNYSEAIVASLDSDRFNPLWTNLVSSIKCMSMVLDADIKQQCNDLIDDCYTENEVDLTFLKQYFPKIRTLTDEYKVQVRQIKDLLQEMKEHEISFPEPQKLEFKFITLGDNKEKTEIAEEILFTVWQEALERVKDSTKFKSVRIEVDKILQTIRNMPDLIDVTAVHKCIIVGICFDSPTGILELLSYLEDETFQQSITIIEIELEVVFDCCIKIMSNFTLESLHDITTNKAKGDKGKANVIRLPITCKSAEGIMAAWSFCQSKEMEESNMTISKSFSDNLGQSITLQTCLAGFYKHYDDTESESRSAEETIGEEMGIIECTTQTASEKLNGFLKPDPRQMGKYSSKMTGEQMDTMECTTHTVSETINGCGVRDQGQIIKYADMMKGEQMNTMECTAQTVSETINGCGEHDQGQIMKYADMMKETLSTDSICGYYTSSSKEQSEDWTGKNKQSPEMFEAQTYIDPIRLTPSSESTNNEDWIIQEQKPSIQNIYVFTILMIVKFKKNDA